MIAVQEMIKTSTPPLIYTTQEELKTLLAKGVIINMGKTWFSLNKRGQNCVMISAAECMIPLSNTNIRHSHDYDSRFVTGNCLMFRWEFKTHIQTQFLSPKTVYTVNLVFKIKKDTLSIWSSYGEPTYVTIGADPSFLYFADEREDGWLTAKLYKFTSEGRYVDLEIIFESIANYDSSVLVVEGIEFQPLEKVDHEDETDGQIAKKLYLFFGRGFPIKYVEGLPTPFKRKGGVKLFPVLIFRFEPDHRVALAAPTSLPFLGINPVELSNL
ncbi:hypothetical protein E3N88_00811 [Mikania micrantha]|uniref:Uncharacterized protein n=1 Tax=Mikania micrantha TaxID=192012 RepID=A0A5N6PZ80_9ASTR|nr:hypothetical protein E3N88_00811 [Mikania micrantha]